MDKTDNIRQNRQMDKIGQNRQKVPNWAKRTKLEKKDKIRHKKDQKDKIG